MYNKLSQNLLALNKQQLFIISHDSVADWVVLLACIRLADFPGTL